jgi:hypothetical protein
MNWLIIIVFAIIFYSLGRNTFSSNVNKPLLICTMVFMDLVSLMSVLFRHYLLDKLWILGSVIPIILIALNIFFKIISVIKFKSVKPLINFIVPIISMILLYNNIDNEIAIKIELNKAKKKYEKIINNEFIETKDIYMRNGLYAFVFLHGVIDNWVALIYDDSGIMEKGLNIIKNNTGFFESSEYEEIKELFGGDIIYIRKLENNWYLCSFT